MIRPYRYAAATALTAALVAGCAASSGPSAPAATAGASTPGPSKAGTPAPTGAARLVTTTVQVPASMRTGPFDQARTLQVPAGWTASVYARVDGARFMASTPDGNLLVSRPGDGSIALVRAGGAQVTTYVSGLDHPHDMVFATIGGRSWLYVSESDGVIRYPWRAGDTAATGGQQIISGLPDASSSALHGTYAHELKNIAVGPDGTLYVSIASATNSDPVDTTSDPVRGAIYAYDPDGTNPRLFARGLRNAEGLAFPPGSSTLWAAVNNRDNTAYPFHRDITGDGTDDYGKIVPSYVDNHPPDEFTKVVEGGNYGWPFANPDPDTAAGLDDMPFDLDVQNNADGSHGAADSFTRISKGIQAHSAALGLTFLGGTKVAQPYRDGVAIALHGSWNRTQRTGYKVVWFPWNARTGTPGAQQDLVTGWSDGTNVWGRPVDVAVDPQGGVLVSDDLSGTVYRLAPTVAP